MDENLMPILDLWDPVIAEQTRSKLSSTSSRRTGKKIDKDGYLQDVEGVYHAIGGFARLAFEANQDPKWFYNRFGDRLLPNIKEEHDVNITILPALPRSPLDGEYTEVEDGQHSGNLPSSLGGGDEGVSERVRVRGGDAPPGRDLLSSVRGGPGSGAEGDPRLRSRELDQGGHQASRSPAPGARRSGGSEDPSQQDGQGSPFE